MLASAQVADPKQLASSSQVRPVMLSFTVPSPQTTKRPTLSKQVSGGGLTSSWISWSVTMVGAGGPGGSRSPAGASTGVTRTAPTSNHHFIFWCYIIGMCKVYHISVFNSFK